ncbi:succinate dehydrogenase cytochrome b subunit [Thecamonas trahens ATCC 50062]|uniref:Succinate dehydrogenase cytochrome b subunit n=1 Tax=Thecamonas trahens ATCC 50062 TaxID=461836 RepID=A0A0L0DNX4_THETB|nr:succinate dehydrogenase cytochrome b subunit [Thecamonas trahens ATCC 50062]KNC53716.1 succinate dehydrogenase cytochrome b subunit [Thecamonas trahens ATCC 50062]|eukprot:XP_013762030.1 succinate dehydrogenase cytochrome b subunit [Thecamonas trahens ATCC 50062]
MLRIVLASATLRAATTPTSLASSPAVATALAGVRTLTSSSAAAAGEATNRNAKRPISPHVTVYKFPVTAISSIMNRVTGMALVGGLATASLVYLPSSGDITDCVHAFKDAAPALVPLAKFSVAFPLTYHYLASARHIYWDATAKGLDLESVNTSSTAIIGSASALSAVLAFM